jgi:MFS family permease
MEKKLEIKIKLSVFAIAFTLGLSAAGISPILGLLNDSFSQSISSIQMLQTIAQFLLMLGSIMIGWLTTRFSKKNIAIAGLIMIGVFGMIPFVVSGYGAIFFSRLLVGYGFGILAPINTAIIAEYIPPKNRPAYLGLNAIGMGIGSLFVNLLGGYLGNFGYRYYFLMHLEVIIVLFFIVRNLPYHPIDKTIDKKQYRMNRSVYELSAMAFFYAIFITVFATNIGIYLGELFKAGSNEVGRVSGINAAFALIIGMSFSRLVNRLKKNTLPIATITAVIGFVALLFMKSTPIGIYFGSACLGMSISCYMSMSAFLISISVEQVAVAKASGILSVISGLGNLLSPLIMNGLAHMLLGQTTTTNVFIVSTVGMIILTAVSYLVVSRKFE